MTSKKGIIVATILGGGSYMDAAEASGCTYKNAKLAIFKARKDGLLPPAAPRCWDGKDKQSAMDEYALGVDAGIVAAKYGVTRKQVTAAAVYARRKRPTIPMRNRPAKTDADAVLAMTRSGMTQKQIAARFRTNKTRVQRVQGFLRANGHELKPRTVIERIGVAAYEKAISAALDGKTFAQISALTGVTIDGAKAAVRAERRLPTNRLDGVSVAFDKPKTNPAVIGAARRYLVGEPVYRLSRESGFSIDYIRSTSQKIKKGVLV